MPVRINLKELFGSDSQNITVDKINFNFNKLLELGIGLKGDIGSTGPEGPVGPAGIQGEIGTRGSMWIAGAGNPNVQTFPDLINGDGFVDGDNDIMYQYDSLTETWEPIIDIQESVNAYMILAGGAFTRGLGTGSPDDNRFIVFPNRGNTETDAIDDGYQSSASNSDTLFLSNFNEKLPAIINIPDFPTNVSELFTALQTIYVNIIDGAGTQRSHMELGSLFKDVNDGDKNILSKSNSNLKLLHIAESDLGGLNRYKGVLSLTQNYAENDTPDGNTILEINTFSIDDNNTPGVNLDFRFGGARGLLGFEPSINGYIDGFQIVKTGDHVSLGILNPYDSVNIHKSISNTSYFALNTSTIGFLLEKTVHQYGGDIKQLGFELTDITNSALVVSPNNKQLGCTPVLQIGDTLYSIKSLGPLLDSDAEADLTINSTLGRISTYDISKNGETISIADGSYNASRLIASVGFQPTAVTDMQALGDSHIIVANNQWRNTLSNTYKTGVTGDVHFLQLLKYTEDIGSVPIQVVDKIGLSVGTPNITDGDKLSGAYRIIVNGSNVIVGCNTLRLWGEDAIADQSNLEMSNGLVSIDYSDLQNPVIVDSEEARGRHILAMERYGEGVLVVAVDLPIPVPGVTYYSGHTVNVKYYRTECDGTISDSNVAIPIIALNGNITRDSLHAYPGGINPFASISSSGAYSYVMYGNDLRTYKFSTTAPNASLTLSAVNQRSINSTSDGNEGYNPSALDRVFDSKVIGTDLYILTSRSSGTSYYDVVNATTIIYKFSIEKPGEPVFITRLQLSSSLGTSFVVSGGNLYITDPGVVSGLTKVSMDAIRTSHGNIGNLKSTDITVTNVLNVGHNLIVNDGINTGNLHATCSISANESLRVASVFTANNRTIQVDAIDAINIKTTIGNGGTPSSDINIETGSGFASGNINIGTGSSYNAGDINIISGLTTQEQSYVKIEGKIGTTEAGQVLIKAGDTSSLTGAYLNIHGAGRELSGDDVSGFVTIGAGTSGNITLYSGSGLDGTAAPLSDAGNIRLIAGDSGNLGPFGGSIQLHGGKNFITDIDADGPLTATGAWLHVNGAGVGGSVAGGSINMVGGQGGPEGKGGNIYIQSGDSGGNISGPVTRSSGDITLQTGNPHTDYNGLANFGTIRLNGNVSMIRSTYAVYQATSQVPHVPIHQVTSISPITWITSGTRETLPADGYDRILTISTQNAYVDVQLENGIASNVYQRIAYGGAGGDTRSPITIFIPANIRYRIGFNVDTDWRLDIAIQRIGNLNTNF